MDDFRIVFCTVPSKKTADLIAKAVLNDRLAACVNCISGVESSYWWKGRIERSKEMLLIMKTKKEAVESLEKCIKEKHPYEVPEIICVDIKEGHREYLEWIGTSVKGAKGKK